MRFIKIKWLFLLLMLASIIVFLISIIDMSLNKSGWYPFVIASYVVLIILTIVLMVLTRVIIFPGLFKKLVEFEKIPKGELRHFKCPQCNSFFALEEAYKQQCPIEITCPSCGVAGIIPLQPQTMKGTIPKKKSKLLRFKCDKCSEEIILWAEGSDITTDVKVTICPYCGEQKHLKKI